jgi:hypothetical protein
MIPLKQIPVLLAIFLVGSLSSIGYGQADPVPQEASDPKGAIIIASIEGQVAVTNNTTGAALPAPAVAAGKILFDGHTIKTGPNGKVILLFSTGTVTTLKADSTLNIKKFTQGKIPAGTNLNTIKEEPSASDVLIDLNVGDMVVDIKKLKKESSFDIDSPVGTAGIRGTRVGMNIRPAAGGGWMSKITVPRGAISFTPLAILGAPPPIPVPVLAGQAVAPAVTDTGAVTAAPVAAPAAPGDLAAINADLDDAGAAASNSMDMAPAPSDGPDSEDAPQKDGEEEAPSEEEINEEDDERQAASKGVGDDNSSSEAVALDKAGLLDLDDPEQLEQVETFVEVTDAAATMFKSKQDKEAADAEEAAANGNANAAQRRAGGEEEDESVSFLKNLIEPDENGKRPLADVVDVTESAESVGANDESTLTAVLDNAEKADDLKVVIAAAEKAESKDKDTLGAVLRNAEQGDKLAAVVATAEKADVDSDDSTTSSAAAAPVGENQKKKLDSLFKVVKKVDEKQKETSTAVVVVPDDKLDSDQQKDFNDLLSAIGILKTVAEVDKKVEDSGENFPEQQEKIKEFADSRKRDINVFGNLEDVVVLTETATDIQKEAEDAARKAGKNADEIKAAGEVGGEAGFEAVLENADKADKLVKVVDAAKGAGADDSLAAVLKSAEQADKLAEVAGIKDASDTDSTPTAHTASQATLSALFKVVKKVDDNQEEVKAAPAVVALNADDIFGKLGDVVSLTETATKVESDAGFDSVLENAKDADKLVEIVKAAESIVDPDKDKVAADATLRAVLKSADRVDDLALVAGVGKTETEAKAEAKAKAENVARAAGKSDKEIKAAGEVASEAAKADVLTAETDTLRALFKVVQKVDDAKETAKTAAPDAAGAVNVADVFDNIEAVVELAETAADAGGDANAKSDFLDKVLSVADEAKEFSAVVQGVKKAQMETGEEDSAALGDLLSLATTKGEDGKSRVADLARIAGVSIVETGEGDAKVVEAQAGTTKLTALLDVVKEVHKREKDESTEITADSVFDNLDLVVDLAVSTGTVDNEGDRTAALESVLKTANNENAKLALQAANDVAGDLTDSTHLAAVLKNTAQAVELQSLVGDANNDAADIAKVLKNAHNARSLHKVIKKAKDDAKDRVERGDKDATADISGLLKQAETADKLEKVVDQLDDLGVTAEQATAVFTNIKDLAIVVGKADANTDLSTLFENADQAVELVDVIDSAGADVDLQKVIANADQALALKEMSEQAENRAKEKAKQTALKAGKTEEEANEAAKVAGDRARDNVFNAPEQANDMKDLADETKKQAGDKAKADALAAGKTEDEAEEAAEAAKQNVNIDELLENPEQAGDTKKMADTADEKAKKEARDKAKADALADGKTEEEAEEEAEEAAKNTKADRQGIVDRAGEADALQSLSAELRAFAVAHPEYYKIAKESAGETGEIADTSLLNDLVGVGLTLVEFKKVLDDLKTGPAEGSQPGDAPTNQPVDPNTVSLLANHEIKDDTINANLVLNAELAFASSFFQDVAQVYDSLSGPSDAGESTARNFNVLGGKNVSISAGSYDIGGHDVYGGPGNDAFIIAATDKLTIAGNAAFLNDDESTTDGLILLSAGSVSLPQGTVDDYASVSYSGDSLGIGSMETLNVINVDLQAEGGVSLRSLDSLVINNSSLRTTNGNGADFVHLRALDEINANGLLFSLNMHEIVMDAMTINLANVAFPGGSTVYLNSASGPLDNKYPTFGSQNKAYGRVNFIENIRYGQHLLNSRSAFDTYGGSISIGTK